MLSPADVVAMVLQSILMAVYAVVALRATLKTKWAGRTCKLMKAWKAMMQPADLSDADKALLKKMQATRISNIWLNCRLACLMIFPASCIATASSARSFVPLDSPTLCVRLMGFSMAFPVWLCPRLLTAKTLPVWHFGLFLLTLLNFAPGICPSEMLSFSCRMSTIAITVTNCAVMQLWTSLFQHGIYMLAAGLSFASSPVHGEDWYWHVRAELIWAMWSCGAGVLIRSLVEAQHRSSMEATSLLEKQLANNKLLRMFYEVVLEVDSELTITSSDPDLGLFLPHPAGHPIPALLGTNLSTLLPDKQDRQLLQERMHRPLMGEEACVDVMHVKMSCGGNNDLRVELFYLGFQSFTGERRHLFGIREFGDEGEAGSRAHEPCMVMQIDIDDPGLSIVGISPALQHELGAAALGSSLTQFLEDAPEFLQQFQYAVNSSWYYENPDSTFKTVLRPVGRRTRILTDCLVTVDNGADKCVARLCFSNLVPVYHSRSGSASIGRRGSTSSASTGSRSSSWQRGTPRQLRGQLLGPSPQAVQLGLKLSL